MHLKASVASIIMYFFSNVISNFWDVLKFSFRKLANFPEIRKKWTSFTMFWGILKFSFKKAANFEKFVKNQQVLQLSRLNICLWKWTLVSICRLLQALVNTAFLDSKKIHYFKIRFEIRFVVESYTNLKKIKIRFDIRFDVFVI